MKKIFLAIAIIFVSLNCIGQTREDDNRERINIGDYEFRRYVPIGSEKEHHGNIEYVHFYNMTEWGVYEYGVHEEMAVLKAHIERNKKYYEETYKCVIESIYYWHILGIDCLMITVVYPDWEEEYNRQQEEYNRQQSELKKANDAARKKRLESINW